MDYSCKSYIDPASTKIFTQNYRPTLLLETLREISNINADEALKLQSTPCDLIKFPIISLEISRGIQPIFETKKKKFCDIPIKFPIDLRGSFFLLPDVIFLLKKKK